MTEIFSLNYVSGSSWRKESQHLKYCMMHNASMDKWWVNGGGEPFTAGVDSMMVRGCLADVAVVLTRQTCLSHKNNQIVVWIGPLFGILIMVAIMSWEKWLAFFITRKVFLRNNWCPWFMRKTAEWSQSKKVDEVKDICATRPPAYIKRSYEWNML